MQNLMNIPTLRFPEFKGEWSQKKLSELANRITRKNKEGNENVLTISAQYGLISQLEYFKKSVSAKDVSGYYLLKKNDFAYNKSYSKGYPMGAIKRLTNYDKGVVSTLYICFKNNNNFDDSFAEQYFDSGNQNKEIEKFAQEGARNHGLLNIGINDFFDINLIIPEPTEQIKIASFLSTIDKKILALTSKKNLLESYKHGIVQKLISQEIRLRDENNNIYPDWIDRKLGDVLHEHKLKSTGTEDVFSVSVNKGLINQIEHLGRSYAASNTDHYNLVQPNDVVYTKSPTGDFPLGIIKQSKIDKNVIVSPLYGVFTPESKGLGYLLNVYFESPTNTSNYLCSLIQKGAKNTINITNTTFLSKEMKLPTSIDEQNKIGDFLEVIDKKITEIVAKIDKVESWKKGLLQKMFC